MQESLRPRRKSIAGRIGFDAPYQKCHPFLGLLSLSLHMSVTASTYLAPPHSMLDSPLCACGSYCAGARVTYLGCLAGMVHLCT